MIPMKNLPFFVLPILLISNIMLSQAQTSALQFDAASWNFGTIAEADGRVSHRFEFENRSGRPVTLTSVTAACGCTAADFSKRPVLPGERSSVVVTYDPTNRAGAFDKVVSVFVSGETDPVRLRITGRVVPRERTVEELYPCDLGGGLRAAATSYAFGYVRHAMMQRSAIGLVNRSSKPIDVAVRFGRRSGRLTASVPARLEPNERAAVDFGYDLPAGCGVYGTLRDEIGFEVDGVPVRGRIEVRGVAVDNPLSYSDNSAPKAELSEIFIKFGPIKRSAGPATRWISLRNTGQRTLTVRAVECSAFGCTLRAGERIAPGAEAKVGIRLTPAGCACGAVVERIRIVTDDPVHPMLTVRATAAVEE